MTDEIPTLFDNQPEPMKPWQGGPADLAGPGQARQSDPDTSHRAATLIKAKAFSARVLLLEAFGAAGEGGLTDEEAAIRAHLSLSSEYATRCSELDRMGVITTTTKRRAGRSGLERVVRVITPDGWWVLRRRAS